METGGRCGSTSEILITRFKDNEKSMAVSHARLLNQLFLSVSRLDAVMLLDTRTYLSPRLYTNFSTATQVSIWNKARYQN